MKKPIAVSTFALLAGMGASAAPQALPRATIAAAIREQGVNPAGMNINDSYLAKGVDEITVRGVVYVAANREHICEIFVSPKFSTARCFVNQ